jgi:oxaloacetate decarboxylase beta subunit
MEIGLGNLPALPGSLTQLSWANLLMMAVGGLLIYLAIAKEYEPVLLFLIGMGANAVGQVASVVAGGILLALVAR